MTEITRPGVLDTAFASVIQSTKADFVTELESSALIAQHGAATIEADDWPGWPADLASTDPVIETYVAGRDDVTATSDNDPFVAAWRPLAEWVNTAVRSALDGVGAELEGDAFVTASLTATELLEGAAHMDDDTFVPTESVGVVAIIGELAGPRVATAAVKRAPLRPMSQVTFTTEQLDDFAADRADHCRCDANQLVVFPQFGQLHAGPAAHHVAHLAATRQLLVFRAKVGSIRPRATLR